MKLIVTLFFSLLFVFCSSRTPEEKALLEGLRKDFGHKYSFKVRSDIYLQIFPADSVENDDLLDIHTRFWDKFPRIRLVYINIYDKNGKFLYQNHLDHITGKVSEGNKEFH